MTDRTPSAAEKDDLITSRENRWLKRFRAALRGTGPAEDEPIGVEGPKLVEDALRSGLEAEALLVCESAEPALNAILTVASSSEAGIPRSRILLASPSDSSSMSTRLRNGWGCSIKLALA